MRSVCQKGIKLVKFFIFQIVSEVAFSVLSAVGLAPLAVCGSRSFKALLYGARGIYTDFFEQQVHTLLQDFSTSKANFYFNNTSMRYP